MCAVEVRETDEYQDWFESLRDRAARYRIAVRIRRLADGNYGDIKRIGAGVSELRIPYGPGYRVYLSQPTHTEVVLLTGGDKSTQRRDIQRAREIVAELEERTCD